MNKVNIWISAAIILLIAAVLGNAWFQRERSVPIAVENNAVKSFFADKLDDLQGKSIDLSQYRGK
ncbi:MAG: alkyl hydroperoxide reductase, partial [Thiomonas sp. 15-63-373]